MEPKPAILELKVYDLATEHWVLANLPCPCGGRWVASGEQRLVEVDGQPCDEIDAACATCGQPVTFRFDVSAFIGHRSETAAWIARMLPDADDRTRARIAREIGPPLMTRITSFIQRLANAGDHVTLAYMRSRINEALTSIRTDELDSSDGESGA